MIADGRAGVFSDLGIAGRRECDQHFKQIVLGQRQYSARGRDLSRSRRSALDHRSYDRIC
jgi:hypothetical protein